MGSVWLCKLPSVADAEAMTKAVAAFYRVHLRALGDGTYTLE